MFEKNVTLAKNCEMCANGFAISVPSMAYEQWSRQEKFVQDAFPELSAADRELFFISGICGECFDAMFSDM